MIYISFFIVLKLKYLNAPHQLFVVVQAIPWRRPSVLASATHRRSQLNFLAGSLTMPPILGLPSCAIGAVLTAVISPVMNISMMRNQNRFETPRMRIFSATSKVATGDARSKNEYLTLVFNVSESCHCHAKLAATELLFPGLSTVTGPAL